jgi:hypothetical protein
MSRAQQAVTAYSEEVADLQSQLAKAESKLARARSNVEFFASRAQQATNLASRSWTPSGDPLERASHEAHRMFREASRAMWADVTAGRPTRAPRPFAGGLAVRGEPPACPACAAIGASETESFQIHHSNADGELLAASPEEPVRQPVPGDGAERARATGVEMTRTLSGAGISVR